MLWIKYYGMEYGIILKDENTVNGNQAEGIQDVADGLLHDERYLPGCRIDHNE